jgi:hypothetical protein
MGDGHVLASIAERSKMAVYIDMYMCVYVYVCMYKNVCMHLHRWPRDRRLLCVCVYMYIYIYTCMTECLHR